MQRDNPRRSLTASAPLAAPSPAARVPSRARPLAGLPLARRPVSLALAAALALNAALFATPARAERFAVADIDVQGTERFGRGTVLANMPVDVGEYFDSQRDAGRVIKSLYATGLFDDVSLLRRGDTLVVRVSERPAIGEINIEGNHKLDDEQMLDSLKQLGIATGRVYNRSTLETVERELRRLYFSTGNYGLRLESRVEELPRNRVAVNIDIAEGSVAHIRQINIVGNNYFSEEDLLDLLESSELTSVPFSTADQYSRAKLAGDLEILRSYYQDRGFIRADIESTQVSISPDKKDIFVTIKIDEGERYTVSGARLAGDLAVPEEQLRGLLQLAPGADFSRALMNASSDAITERLGEDGYAFANVNVVPEIDDEKRSVDLTYFIDPGKRAYVRRISFRGASGTEDRVFRREMRLLEGGRFDPALLRRSRVRLQRLRFVQAVTVETPRVPGRDDQVDVIFSITEGPSGSFTIGAGYGSDGFLFNLGLTQDNLLGSGERMSFNFDNSESVNQLEASFTDPYYTPEGISRTWRAYVRETDASQVSSTTDYISDSYGASLGFNVPITEFANLGLGAAFDRTEVTETAGTSDEIKDYLAANGTRFDVFSLTSSLSHDTRNRTVFAETGTLNRLNLQVGVPGSDVEFFKLGYRFEWYTPLSERLVLSTNARLDYGDGYGDFDELPFFERYFAGGVRSLRGYDGGSLGPRDSTGDAAGGDFRSLGSLELIFPPPFVDEPGSTRFSLFVDVGNVFADVDDWDADVLRGSYGVAFVWLSPVGPLTFSLAEAFNDEPGDDLESFQFTIGSIF